jgi:microcystin degradation protein MlrC
MRVGVLSLIHESNTFLPQPTEIENFRSNLIAEGKGMRAAFEGAHHEVAGVFESLEREKFQAIPLFSARAIPSGAVTRSAWEDLLAITARTLRDAGPLDGIVACPHGALVTEPEPDGDGAWLAEIRKIIGPDTPLVATIDPHANLSPRMIDQCNAMVAYHTNPHLDQRARGLEAGTWMTEILRGNLKPTMAAAFPPMAINIERQCTDEEPLKSLFAQAAADARESESGVSCSIVLGFPYSDVAEMGSSAIAVTNNRPDVALELAMTLGEEMWRLRRELVPTLLDIETCLSRAQSLARPVCLLDMGDNVGGGSPADGTWIAHALLKQTALRGFVCINDPAAVQACLQQKVGSEFDLTFGGKIEASHGPPISAKVKLIGQSDGKFREPNPRHGGFTDCDQGVTVVVEVGKQLTVMLTSMRMPPFSLGQLHCGNVRPQDFDVLVAKGVNAPIAAYREVCPSFLRVNTAGSTTADMNALTYQHRRRPMFPWEDCSWTPSAMLSATAKRDRA